MRDEELLHEIHEIEYSTILIIHQILSDVTTSVQYQSWVYPNILNLELGQTRFPDDILLKERRKQLVTVAKQSEKEIKTIARETIKNPTPKKLFELEKTKTALIQEIYTSAKDLITFPDFVKNYISLLEEHKVEYEEIQKITEGLIRLFNGELKTIFSELHGHLLRLNNETDKLNSNQIKLLVSQITDDFERLKKVLLEKVGYSLEEIKIKKSRTKRGTTIGTDILQNSPIYKIRQKLNSLHYPTKNLGIVPVEEDEKKLILAYYDLEKEQEKIQNELPKIYKQWNIIKQQKVPEKSEVNELIQILGRLTRLRFAQRIVPARKGDTILDFADKQAKLYTSFLEKMKKHRQNIQAIKITNGIRNKTEFERILSNLNLSLKQSIQNIKHRTEGEENDMLFSMIEAGWVTREQLERTGLI